MTALPTIFRTASGINPGFLSKGISLHVVNASRDA